MQHLPILQLSTTNNLNEFVEFWSKLYAYPKEDLYDSRITKPQFDKTDLEQFYEWKNGMELSTAKKKSLNDKIIPKLQKINNLKARTNWSHHEFLKEFTKVKSVWKIFLLHIIKPNQYPIYDQHIHRAYNYIHGYEYKSISSSSLVDIEKERFYFETYVKFTQTANIDLRKLDKAFFTFGQFLQANKRMFA